MRLHELERKLSAIPPHPAPKLELEQYATPADVAAPLLFEAWTLGDVAGKRVADLGCGTGVFALGAAILAADEVEAVDADEDALVVARREAARLGVETRISWTRADVGAWNGVADTVIMNPPFGAQQRGADRAFLDAAFRAAPVVYTMHNATTRAFVEEHAARAAFAITHAWALRFALKHQYRHHEKPVRAVDVVALRLRRTES